MVVVPLDEVSDLPGRMVSFCQSHLSHSMGDPSQSLPNGCLTENFNGKCHTEQSCTVLRAWGVMPQCVRKV